jgi:hypothetical protein
VVDPWDDDSWANETRFPHVSLDTDLSLQVRSTGAGGWILGLLDLSFFGSVDESQKGPRVVLVNGFGREHVVKQYTSVRKATRGLARIKADIDEAGYFSWAEEVAIPPHFDVMRPD